MPDGGSPDTVAVHIVEERTVVVNGRQRTCVIVPPVPWPGWLEEEPEDLVVASDEVPDDVMLDVSRIVSVVADIEVKVVVEVTVEVTGGTVAVTVFVTVVLLEDSAGEIPVCACSQEYQKDNDHDRQDSKC